MLNLLSQRTLHVPGLPWRFMQCGLECTYMRRPGSIGGMHAAVKKHGSSHSTLLQAGNGRIEMLLQ